MSFINWDEKLSVNIKDIDWQHKRLVDLINTLHDAMKVGKGPDIMAKIFTELLDYTVYHFGTEEKLFQRYDYPDYAGHKKEHDDLTKQAIELKKKFDSNKLAITMDTMEFLQNWLKNHIMGTDKKYSSFLNSKGVL